MVKDYQPSNATALMELMDLEIKPYDILNYEKINGDSLINSVCGFRHKLHAKHRNTSILQSMYEDPSGFFTALFEYLKVTLTLISSTRGLLDNIPGQVDLAWNQAGEEKKFLQEIYSRVTGPLKFRVFLAIEKINMYDLRTNSAKLSEYDSDREDKIRLANATLVLINLLKNAVREDEFLTIVENLSPITGLPVYTPDVIEKVKREYKPLGQSLLDYAQSHKSGELPYDMKLSQVHILNQVEDDWVISLNKADYRDSGYELMCRLVNSVTHTMISAFPFM